jgi:ABC-type glutathione transport system ATPase component
MIPTTAPLLAVSDLTVTFDVDGQKQVAVSSASFEVRKGEILAIVGESGSGKSVSAMSILGLLPANAEVGGSIRFGDVELLGLSKAKLRSIRGARIAMIFQDPAAALNPVFTIGFQLIEAIREHNKHFSKAQARARSIELLESVEVPEAETRLRYYPHELSGGQCQRVMIAMALACDPELLIADEPTTALDVTVQAEVLEVLRSMRERLSASILIITHDMGVVADMADRVVVMRRGEIVETADVDTLFAAPAAAYTRELLDAVPRLGARDAPEQAPDAAEPVLEISRLTVDFGNALKGRFRAVDDASLTVGRGEIVALVGESGSGKTTLGRAAIGLSPVTGGTVAVNGLDLKSASRSERHAMRQTVGVVFQNPATSLNPRYSIGETVEEPLRVHLGLRGSELRDRADALLTDVGLGGAWRERYPHELSGGQRQRVAIARAVSLEPALLIADEPTSALDVSVQAKVLDVFRELQQRLGFACLFISHDLAVVDSLCDRVAVMQRGVIIEQGERSVVLGSPEHDYTRRLIASAPVPHPAQQRERRLARLAS